MDHYFSEWIVFLLDTTLQRIRSVAPFINPVIINKPKGKVMKLPKILRTIAHSCPGSKSGLNR